MRPKTKERRRSDELNAIKKLHPLGFDPVGDMKFKKDNIVYDLSAADLTQIERIEREGLFVIEVDEVI